MNISRFNKGICLSSSGSLWWGLLGTYYFQYISFIGTLEVVVHRSLWTRVMLLLTTIYLSKWNILMKVINNFLPEDTFKKLQDKLTSPFFPWYYNPIVVYKDDPRNHFQFIHFLYNLAR